MKGPFLFFFPMWNENSKQDGTLACNNHIFRNEQSLPPYSFDYDLDKKIKERLKTTLPQYKSRVIYSETNRKINHDDKVYSKAAFVKKFSKQLKKEGLVTHVASKTDENINSRIHEKLKGKGVRIDDKTYKYCEPQFIPNYFCFRDDKDVTNQPTNA